MDLGAGNAENLLDDVGDFPKNRTHLESFEKNRAPCVPLAFGEGPKEGSLRLS